MIRSLPKPIFLPLSKSLIERTIHAATLSFSVVAEQRTMSSGMSIKTTRSLMDIAGKPHLDITTLDSEKTPMKKK
jgi:hypothetical protein